MAEDQTAEVVESEDEDYDKWLAALEDDEDDAPEEAEVKAEREDDKALKVARTTQKVVSEYITEKKVDDMKEKFLAEASDTAKELFAIYCTGDETPKQLKRIMDLAKTKDAETQKTDAATDEEIAEQAEKKAAQIARESYGVSPLPSGRAIPDQTPDQHRYDEAFSRVSTKGDPMALLGLMAEDSDFIDAVLTGQPLRKK